MNELDSIKIAEDSKKACDLITSMDGTYRKFDTNGRLAFAYNYWQSNDEDILQIFEGLATLNDHNPSKKALARLIKINKFLCLQGIDKVNIPQQTLTNLSQNQAKMAVKRMRKKPIWSNQFEFDKNFDITNPKQPPVQYKYETADGIKIIGIEDAKKICEILDDNNVPTADIIVRQSYRYYANKNICAFIELMHKMGEKHLTK